MEPAIAAIGAVLIAFILIKFVRSLWRPSSKSGEGNSAYLPGESPGSDHGPGGDAGGV
jgi:hypothetical protein